MEADLNTESMATLSFLTLRSFQELGEHTISLPRYRLRLSQRRSLKTLKAMKALQKSLLCAITIKGYMRVIVHEGSRQIIHERARIKGG